MLPVGGYRRADLMARLAGAVPQPVGDDCVRVGVDGVDGSGKTVFAAELTVALRRLGRAVVQVSVDDFHHVRAVRYRRGRTSPEGFWLDSFNYPRLAADVLEPLGPGGSRRYRRAAHDLVSDQVLNPPYATAAAGCVLVVDGLFLHRAELAPAWDMSIFLDVPFEVTAARMAARDGTSPDPDDPSLRRYVDAQLLYFAASSPHERASVVVDNSDLETPRIIRATFGE